MTEDLIQLVDRQFQFLDRQSGGMFIRELRRTLDAISREPRLAAILDDERREALSYQAEFDQHCATSVSRLTGLRYQFSTLLAEHDDSAAPRPEGVEIGDHWFHTLAAFDKVTGGEGAYPQSNAWDHDDSRPAQLIRILRKKFHKPATRCPRASRSRVRRN